QSPTSPCGNRRAVSAARHAPRALRTWDRLAAERVGQGRVHLWARAWENLPAKYAHRARRWPARRKRDSLVRPGWGAAGCAGLGCEILNDARESDGERGPRRIAPRWRGGRRDVGRVVSAHGGARRRAVARGDLPAVLRATVASPASERRGADRRPR